eukprot:UN04947
MAEIGKMLGEAWKNASGTVRSKYENSKQFKEKYDVAVGKISIYKKCKEYLSIREEYDAERKQMNKKPASK